MKIYRRPKFLEDMAREELYLLDHAGADIADRWHESLWSSIMFLSRHPLAGRRRTDLEFPDIRSWRLDGFERWIIFYGARENDLVLYRVVCGNMDIYALAFN